MYEIRELTQPPRRCRRQLLSWLTFSKKRCIWSFHVVVLRLVDKKCTEIYKALTEPLYCSLNVIIHCLATFLLPLLSWFA